MALTQRSNKAALSFSQVETLAAAHIARVIADGGTVASTELVNTMFADLLSAEVNTARVLYYGAAETGLKLSGANVLKAYSLVGAGGDMAPIAGATGTATLGAAGTPSRQCIIFAGDMTFITAGSLVTPESTLVLEARATNAALRDVARIDASNSTASSNQVGKIEMGNTAGHKLTGYTTGAGTDTLYATYADFQRMAYVTRHADIGEIFVDGVSVANKGTQLTAGQAYVVRYFKMGGQSTAVAINRVMAYGGVLRPWQMLRL